MSLYLPDLFRLSLLFGLPALVLGLVIGSKGGRNGSGLLVTIAACWKRTVFVYFVAAGTWFLAGTILSGLQMETFGEDLRDWASEFLQGLALAVGISTVAAGLPSMMFGAIAYNFAAQKRARLDIASPPPQPPSGDGGV